MIRRMVEADAVRVVAFLKAQFTAEPGYCANPARVTTMLMTDAVKGESSDIWVAEENGAIVGHLSGTHEAGGMENGVEYTANYFDGMVVNKAKTPTARLKLWRDLTTYAANDLRDTGLMRDRIIIEGPASCPGALWCRAMGMQEEDVGGGRHKWRLPFKDIWDRAAKATVK